jgi:hypothetical protein
MDYRELVNVGGRIASDYKIFANMGFLLETAVRMFTNPSMKGSAHIFFKERCERHALAAYGLGGILCALPAALYPVIIILIEHIGNKANTHLYGKNIWEYPPEYVPFNNNSSSVVSTIFFTALMASIKRLLNIEPATL